MTWDIDGTTIDHVTGRILTERTDQTQTLQLRFDSEANYTTIKEYVQYADHVVSGTDVEGVPWFVENPPDVATPTTWFVEITPPAALTTEPFYAVVTGGTIQTNAPETNLAVDLELRWLGETSSYTSKTDARNTLEG